MRTITFFLGVATICLLAHDAAAQGVNTSIIKDRARTVTKQGENRGNEPAPQPGARPGQPAPQATPAQKAAMAQQQSVGKLTSTIAVLKTRPEANPEQNDRLSKDLTACAGTAGAKPESLKKLSTDLGTALPGKKLSSDGQSRLAKALGVLVNCAGLPTPEIQSHLVTVHTVLKEAGVPEDAL